jgi:hypothetical protein
MSTHGCFAPLFPQTRMLRSDDGSQEAATPDVDYYYYQGGAYYEVEIPDDQK